MREDADDLWKAVSLQDVEKLEGFHLETEARVNKKQNKVGNLGDVNHGVEVIHTLYEGEPALLAFDLKPRSESQLC